MMYNEKIHLVDRCIKDNNNRTQEQVWQDLSIRFNAAMKFETVEDVKNGPRQDHVSYSGQRSDHQQFDRFCEKVTERINHLILVINLLQSIWLEAKLGMLIDECNSFSYNIYVYI